MKQTLAITATAILAFAAGCIGQHHHDSVLVASILQSSDLSISRNVMQANALLDESKTASGTLYTTPRGGNWALAHIPVPACPDDHLRVVDAPERDERDAITVYCYDGEESTKDELAMIAGNQ